MANESVKSGPGIPESEREQVERIASLARRFDEGTGKDFRERCERFYRQYRGFRAFKDAWTRSPNDRDTLIYDAKKDWGAHLHIPLSFNTIEQIVPKSIAHAPKILVEGEEQYRENAESMQVLLNRQQEQIDIDLPLQMVMRGGRMYGLGAGKSYWRHEAALRRKVQARVFKLGYKVGRLVTETTFDDPMFEDIDVFDFGWDPMGSDPRTCEWMYHRVWMSTEAVLRRAQEGVWNTDSAKVLDEDMIRSMGSAQAYNDVWNDRLEVSGFRPWTTEERGEAPHEVLELHDGERVLTILDRELLVQDAENPCCGMMPFQIYRPTPLSKQLPGIGDLEPIEHLNRELDTLRSQRRDAATIALCGAFAYDTNLIEERHLVFGPNAAIRVNGDPREAILPLQARDVPASGYEEERAILSNIETVSGIQDALTPVQSGQGTATEAQLVQASLGARIMLGSRRFELEVVRTLGRAWLYLNQRMILEDRQALKIPQEGQDPHELDVGVWKEYPVGPGALMGEMAVHVEGGAMAARNVPQDRSDAQIFFNLAGNPMLKQGMLLEKALSLCGVKHPKAFLKSPEPTVPVGAIEILEQAGVAPELLQHAVAKAQANTPEGQAEAGPNPEQVTQMMGAQPA